MKSKAIHYLEKWPDDAPGHVLWNDDQIGPLDEWLDDLISITHAEVEDLRAHPDVKNIAELGRRVTCLSGSSWADMLFEARVWYEPSGQYIYITAREIIAMIDEEDAR